MTNICSNCHYVVEPLATAWDSSSCNFTSYTPPSHISSDYFVDSANSCIIAKSDGLLSTTYEEALCSHDSTSGPLLAQRHPSSLTADAFDFSHWHCSETFSSTALLGVDSQILPLPFCNVAKPNNDRRPHENKTLSEEKVKRKKAQNRAAQQAFRQREEGKIRDMEDRIAKLEKSTKETLLDSQLRRSRIRDLFIENQRLRQVLLTDSHYHASSRPDAAVDCGQRKTRNRVNEELSGGEEKMACLARICYPNRIAPWWNESRLMLSEEKIMSRLKQIDSLCDELL
ncbi:hypothetical protein X797_010468 [Metarhizium robertsii]|uniref:BZIP domain-containing protein n=1 Tax=Metarhizium robertsii TaxID=568076 RepID=A0A0A1UPB4_9HYPO|nr:hypothetical protein X797_010468 [Metarhizium robertsii]